MVEATYLVAERRPIQAIIVRLKQDAATTKALWSVYIANAERWAKEGWGGSISASSILFVNQVINATQVAASMSVCTLQLHIAWTLRSLNHVATVRFCQIRERYGCVTRPGRIYILGSCLQEVRELLSECHPPPIFLRSWAVAISRLAFRELSRRV